MAKQRTWVKMCLCLMFRLPCTLTGKSTMFRLSCTLTGVTAGGRQWSRQMQTSVKCCVPRRICVTHSFPFEIVVKNGKLVLHVSNDITILNFISESTQLRYLKWNNVAYRNLELTRFDYTRVQCLWLDHVLNCNGKNRFEIWQRMAGASFNILWHYSEVACRNSSGPVEI